MLAFTVPGEPRGKGRPRATIRAGHARLYSDARTASYENLVAMAASDALRGAPPLDGPLTIDIRVRMAQPASASKRKRAEMLSGALAATKKPDLDNVVKAIMDGCNAVAFRDDVLIVRQSAEKLFAETAGVDVRIGRAGERA